MTYKWINQFGEEEEYATNEELEEAIDDIELIEAFNKADIKIEKAKEKEFRLFKVLNKKK